MAAISLNIISDETLGRLMRLASTHNRDLSLEALDCLERGLREREEAERKLDRIRQLHASMPGAWLSDDIIRQAKAERR